MSAANAVDTTALFDIFYSFMDSEYQSLLGEGGLMIGSDEYHNYLEEMTFDFLRYCESAQFFENRSTRLARDTENISLQHGRTTSKGLGK